jgi:carbon monoxide dehydrogenase subunit G
VQVKGQATLPAPRAKVWATLMDSAALEGCLPGVQEFKQVGPTEWEVTLTVGMAGIKGTYKGRVTIAEQSEPDSYRLSAEGSGSGNRVRGTAVVTLTDADGGGTNVDYEGDAQIAGALAMVGQRLFQPAVRMLADQFFKCMGSKVT